LFESSKSWLHTQSRSKEPISRQNCPSWKYKSVENYLKKIYFKSAVFEKNYFKVILHSVNTYGLLYFQ